MNSMISTNESRFIFSKEVRQVRQKASLLHPSPKTAFHWSPFVWSVCCFATWILCQQGPEGPAVFVFSFLTFPLGHFNGNEDGTWIWYQMSQRTRPCLFLATGNGPGHQAWNWLYSGSNIGTVCLVDDRIYSFPLVGLVSLQHRCIWFAKLGRFRSGDPSVSVPSSQKPTFWPLLTQDPSVKTAYGSKKGDQWNGVFGDPFIE